MKFQFVIGDEEQHKVVYEFDKLLTGRARVSVDSSLVYKRFQLIKKSLGTAHEIEFEVGDSEKHNVRIKAKALVPVASGLFPFKYEVSVDGKVVNTYRGWW